MPILMSEFHVLLNNFFESVHCGKKTEDEVAIHFAHQYPLLIAPDGSYFDMHTHRQLHKRFCYEHHNWTLAIFRELRAQIVCTLAKHC